MRSTLTIVSALAFSFPVLCATAQDGGRRAEPGRRPPREGGQQDSRPQNRGQSMTAEQKQQAAAILARYNASSLTAADARAMNDAFRAAGLRNGPDLLQAMRDAGFDPQRVGALAPPPGQRGRAQPQGPEDRREQSRPTERPDNQREPREEQRPGDGGEQNGSAYNIEQAISDRAQLHTIAFDALAFMTGSLGCDTFLPPGKVTDFFGFQYMRDNDQNELGHNTSFVPRVANNVLYILTDEQKAQMVALAKEQEEPIIELATRRFPLIKAFRRLLEGTIPVRSSGLDLNSVRQYTSEVFELDGLLSYQRAQVLGAIVRSLDADQKALFAGMAFNNSATWPVRPDQIDKRSLTREQHVAVMTYASELFSWYAGSIEADVYFCPERHGTYFGSFYLKDLPAMGNPDYSISTALTGDSGEAFLEILTGPQRERITGLIDLQRNALNQIVSTRRAVSVQLRRFMAAGNVGKEAVLSLARKYGQLDGEIAYHYATRFAEVYADLACEQLEELKELRGLGGDCAGAFLYSAPIAMPAIPDTDFLFNGQSK